MDRIRGCVARATRGLTPIRVTVAGEALLSYQDLEIRSQAE
jgi:hypothetical protein